MFCVLEHDLKTYGLFRQYIECFENGGSTLDIDNKIQAEELAAHLRRNGYESTDTQEKLNWIANNGKPFREYLNTVKLIYLMCKVTDIDVHRVSPEDFVRLEEKLNGMRHCLISMF